jgi:hypothetical protein
MMASRWLALIFLWLSIMVLVYKSSESWVEGVDKLERKNCTS